MTECDGEGAVDDEFHDVDGVSGVCGVFLEMEIVGSIGSGESTGIPRGIFSRGGLMMERLNSEFRNLGLASGESTTLDEVGGEWSCDGK